MRLWRISAYPGLSGVGGLHVDGRWHTSGHRVIYAAEHPALAMVEVMAHMRLGLTTIPTTLKLISLDVADGAASMSAPALPAGWQANEPTTQVIGNQWLETVGALLILIPSAIVPHAANYLINPLHSQAATHLTEGEIEPFWFDKRFLR